MLNITAGSIVWSILSLGCFAV